MAGSTGAPRGAHGSSVRPVDVSPSSSTAPQLAAELLPLLVKIGHAMKKQLAALGVVESVMSPFATDDVGTLDKFTAAYESAMLPLSRRPAAPAAADGEDDVATSHDAAAALSRLVNESFNDDNEADGTRPASNGDIIAALVRDLVTTNEEGEDDAPGPLPPVVAEDAADEADGCFQVHGNGFLDMVVNGRPSTSAQLAQAAVNSSASMFLGGQERGAVSKKLQQVPLTTRWYGMCSVDKAAVGELKRDVLFKMHGRTYRILTVSAIKCNKWLEFEAVNLTRKSKVHARLVVHNDLVSQAGTYDAVDSSEVPIELLTTGEEIVANGVILGSV
jgi:hypothetical protein